VNAAANDGLCVCYRFWV